TLDGGVSPNGGEVSECKLEYGTTTSYGSSASCTPAPGSGESPVAVHASLGGLAPNTTYHFRVSATNSGGTSTGPDQSFTTLAANSTPHWYENGSKLPLGEREGTIGCGTMTLAPSARDVTCHS